MEDNKNTNYSPETEEYYQDKTENSINIPEGFVNKVMEKVKTEQAKKKNNIIKWASVAAAFVIVAGAIAVAPKLFGKSSVEVNDATYDTLTDVMGDLEFSEDNADVTVKGNPIIPNSEKISEELDYENINTRKLSILKKMTFAISEDEKLNWYEFYNACIDGTAGSDNEVILAHAKDCLIAFELYEMTEEAAQANEIISALEGSGAN